MIGRFRRVISSQSDSIGHILGGKRGNIFVVVCAGWVFSYGVRHAYPALVPFFRAEFGFDLSTVGLLLTLLWGAYALGQLPGGVLGDRIGERNTLVFSLALSCGAILVVSLASGRWTFFAATILFGFATAMYAPARFSLLVAIYPNRAGTAIGLTMAAGSVGNAVLPIVAVAVASYATWQLGFGSMVPFFLVITVLLWWVLPPKEPAVDAAVDRLTVSTIRELASGMWRGAIPVVFAVQIFTSFVFQGFTGFYPTYLTEVKALAPGTAAALFGLFFITGTGVQPIAGAGIDRFGTRWSLIGILGVITASLLALPFVSGFLPLALLTVFLGSLTGYPPITQTAFADELPDNMVGTGLGFLRTVFMLVGSLGPVVIGVFGSSGHLEAGFLVLAASAGVALLVSIVFLSD